MHKNTRQKHYPLLLLSDKNNTSLHFSGDDYTKERISSKRRIPLEPTYKFNQKGKLIAFKVKLDSADPYRFIRSIMDDIVMPNAVNPRISRPRCVAGGVEISPFMLQRQLDIKGMLPQRLSPLVISYDMKRSDHEQHCNNFHATLYASLDLWLK